MEGDNGKSSGANCPYQRYMRNLLDAFGDIEYEYLSDDEVFTLVHKRLTTAMQLAMEKNDRLYKIPPNFMDLNEYLKGRLASYPLSELEEKWDRLYFTEHEVESSPKDDSDTDEDVLFSDEETRRIWIKYLYFPKESFDNYVEHCFQELYENNGVNYDTLSWKLYLNYQIARNATLEGADTIGDILINAARKEAKSRDFGSVRDNLLSGEKIPDPNDIDIRFLLELCGDVELNPGPVQSNIYNARFLDNRGCELVEKKSRKNRKPRETKKSGCEIDQDELRRELRERIRKLAREIKAEAYAQGGFLSAPAKAVTIGQDLNANLDKVCSFLEDALPGMVEHVTLVAQNTSASAKVLSDELIKSMLCIVLICLLIETKFYKTAFAVLIVVALRVFGYSEQIIETAMDMYRVIRAPKAQGNMEDVVFHPWLNTCGKLIFLLIAVLCLKKLPGKNDVDTFMRRLDSLPKAVKGATQLHEWVSKYFDLSLDHVKAMIVGKSCAEMKKAESSSAKVLAWAARVQDFVRLEQRSKIDSDIAVANEAEALYHTGLQFAGDTLLPPELHKVVNSALRPARDIYEYVTRSPIKGGSRKMRPLMIWLAGQSGIGKTSMVDPLCIDLLRAMGYVGPEHLHSLVYGRQVETEYWDGYKAHKIVIYDDAFQLKDDAVNRNLEVFEVIRSCNTYPQHLHMACLSDKNTFSVAEVYIYTTNEMNVKLESLTHEQAFYNRMSENAFTVRPKEAYRLVEEGSTGNKQYRLDKTKTKGAIDLDVYEFVRMQRINDHPSGWKATDEVYGYAEFSKLMCAEWKRRKTEHQNTVDFLKKYAERPFETNPGPVEDIPIRHDDVEQGVEAQMGRDADWFNNDIAERIARGQDITDILYEYAEDDELHEDYMAYKKQQAQPSKWDKYARRLESAITEGKNFLARVVSKIASVIRENPYLTMMATVGSVLALYGAMRWFSKGVTETFDAEEVTIPNETKVENVVRTEGFESYDHRTPRAHRANRQYVRAEAMIDETGYLVANNKVTGNTYRMCIKRDPDDLVVGNAVFITGWTLLIPYHFVCGLAGRRIAADSIVTLSKPGLDKIIEFPLSRIFRYDTSPDGFTTSEYCARMEHEDGELVDAILVNLHGLGVRIHPDLRGKIVTVRDQAHLSTTFHAILTTMSRKPPLTTSQQVVKGVKPMDKILHINLPVGDKTTQYTQRDCYKYYSVTVVGDCGALLVAQNHAIVRKIFAMHIAGAEENGYACPINQEMLARGFKKFALLEARITAQMSFEAPKDAIEGPCQTPEGLFAPIGKAPIGVGMSTKTAIRPSRLYGRITKPTTAPSYLGKDALYRGLTKCGVRTVNIQPEYIDAAANDVARYVLNQHVGHVDRERYTRILSYEEAVKGVPYDDFMKSVTRVTSPGYPYCLDTGNMPGKSKWMGLEQDFDMTSPAALALRKDVESLLEDCKNGLVRDVVFVDTLKDERRELIKVEAKKTRVFSAGPQHFVIAFRQYFLPFSAWVMHNRIENEVAVGTNPFSMDWHNIAVRMRSKGRHIIAGDFSNFDGSLNAQVLWTIFWKIFVPWLNDIEPLGTPKNEENLRVCTSLWTHLVHSVHICGDNLYMWTHSQPSGNPFTVIINSLYNSVIMRVVWQYIMAKEEPKLRTMNHFNQHVAMVSYGDDNLLNISEGVIDIFNQLTISEAMRWIGHEYTDETKTGEAAPYRTLEEVRFLKRGFRMDHLLCRWVAPLKKDVIYEMLNWTRKGINPDDVTMMIIDTAFREISYHGREAFEKLRGQILEQRDVLVEYPQILTFEEYLFDISANEGDGQAYN
ncbi:non-structural polyprotein [Anopheles C virus]|uniref:non-structural polyprotein n=1 Tax=Anopheles C virus TaxID=1769780 RepID=UPI0007C0E3B5|nr:non-structural polyprotein [Anopheles C virus]ALS55295.1 non-structural polyprotein [Anopheles C virus]